MAERFKFHLCKQEPGETIATKLAAGCEFGEGLEDRGLEGSSSLWPVGGT